MSLIVSLQEFNKRGSKEATSTKKHVKITNKKEKVLPLIVKLDEQISEKLIVPLKKVQIKQEDCKHMSIQGVIDYINNIL